MNYLELKSRLYLFQAKLNAHFQERNSNNLNEAYITWLEKNIKEIKDLMVNLKKVA